MLNLLLTNQSHSLLNYVFNFIDIESRSLAWKTKHVSSAYNSISQPTAPGMSLTYKRNKRGHSIEPWGTPHYSLPGSEKLLSTLTRKVLLVRYDLNHIIVWAEKVD